MTRKTRRLPISKPRTLTLALTVFALVVFPVQAADAAHPVGASPGPLTIAGPTEEAPLDLGSSSQTGTRWLGADRAPLPFTSHDEVLEFLHIARVVSSETLSTGINRPEKLLLERNGVQAHAIFRTVDRDLTPRSQSPHSLHRLRDHWGHEIAAYRLSRLLGLDRIPPVVARRIDGKRGSLQLWLENSVTEAELLTSERRNVRASERQFQRQVMKLFDQLIWNYDRHQANALYDTYGHLWYIDHTRSFKRLNRAENVKKIAVADRQLFDRLRNLDSDELDEALAGFLDKQQRLAIERRRREILEHLDTLIEERGESAVLFDLEGRLQATRHRVDSAQPLQG